MAETKRKIAVAQPILGGNERKYVLDCIDSGWISSAGAYIPKFESEFAQFCESKHGIAVANGTVALHLALLAYGIGPGDEVIVPTLTYIASANAVTYCGAKPVFVDAEPKTWNMDPTLIEAKITSKTRAIMVVHLYGHPTDMDPIHEIAKKHKLVIVEDAAESHGATYKGKKTGSLGDVATFSFFGNKTITTGEGGMVLTDDSALAEKMRLYKGQGMDPKRRYWFPVVGYNYRMTNIQAAIGLAQLENIDTQLNARRNLAKKYNELLKGLDSTIELPYEADWATHSYWMYSIVLKKGTRVNRDQLMSLLAEDGIETRPIFYPMHILPPYLEKNANYPVADQIAAHGINLPTHGALSDSDLMYICDALKKHLL
jgi:perosamine synthetase